MPDILYTTTHEGFVEHRRSSRRITPVYKYAVWGRSGTGKWHVCCYNSRLDLAQTQLRTRLNWHNEDELAIAPVTSEVKTVRRRPLVDFPTSAFERDGVTFTQDPKWPFCRLGSYRGWTIRLHGTGKHFKASAWVAGPELGALEPGRGGQSLYTSKGGLDSRIAKIKALIDAKEAV